MMIRALANIRQIRSALGEAALHLSLLGCCPDTSFKDSVVKYAIIVR
jgi:hypothetical protein